jgi:hypothetical protein
MAPCLVPRCASIAGHRLRVGTGGACVWRASLLRLAARRSRTVIHRACVVLLTMEVWPLLDLVDHMRRLLGTSTICFLEQMSSSKS